MGATLGDFKTSDTATVVGLYTTQVATLPASNALKRMPFDRWRTPSSTGYLTVTYSAAIGVSQIVSLYTNATASGTMRVRAGTNQVTVVNSPVFDSGVIDHQPGARDWGTWGRTHFLLDLSAPISAACWRLDVDQVSGASYYESGRVGFLNPWRPSRGIDFGDEIVPINGTRMNRSRNGTGYAVPGGIYREARLRVSGPLMSEFLASAGDLRRRVEGKVPMLYARSPRADTIGAAPVGGVTMYRDDDLMDQLIYGYLGPDLPYPTNEHWNMQRMVISLEEVVHP